MPFADVVELEDHDDDAGAAGAGVGCEDVPGCCLSLLCDLFVCLCL